MNEKILKAVKDAREQSKKRNFPQTFDMIISLKELDVKKPENKINEDVVLPHGRGGEAKVVVFADNVKTEDADVISSVGIDKISKNKRQAKKLASQTNFFLAEAKLMPVVAKALGQLLGPRNKIPKIIVGDLDKMIASQKRSARVRIKDSPVIQCLVGKEDMKDEHVAENMDAIIKFLEHKLARGKNNIGNVMLKLTMGKPVKVDVYG